MAHVLFLLDCAGSSLLCTESLWSWWVEATLPCGMQASHCGGFSCCRVGALGERASVVAAWALSGPVAWGIFPDQGLNLYHLHCTEVPWLHLWFWMSFWLRSFITDHMSSWIESSGWEGLKKMVSPPLDWVSVSSRWKGRGQVSCLSQPSDSQPSVFYV